MNTEHIDIGLARYSDWAFTSSVVVLVAALLLLAVELAYTRGRKVPSANSSAPEPAASADSATPGRAVSAASADRRTRRAGRAGPGVRDRAAAGVHRAARLATARVPWGNMYEFINLTCSGLVAAAVVLRRPQYRALWVFVLVPVLILLTVSGRWLYTNAAPVMPACSPTGCRSTSRWSAWVRGVPGRRGGQHPVPGQDVRAGRADAEGTLARIVVRLPDAQTLDRIAYRTTIFAFPVFGFGVIFGAIWAEEAWGRYWGWDPRRRCRSSRG